jgi:hypothetical protein
MSRNEFEILLEDGTAQLLGDGLVAVDQIDATAPSGSTHRHNRVVLSREGLEALLAAIV